MAAGVVTPVLVLTAVSFSNNWYNNGSPDLKIPVAGAIAGVVGSALSTITELAPALTMIGWIAVVAYIITSGTGPKSPLGNIQKILNGD